MFDGPQGMTCPNLSGMQGSLNDSQQWYRRRKPSAQCYVGDKFKDPVATEENCACADEDYEW